MAALLEAEASRDPALAPVLAPDMWIMRGSRNYRRASLGLFFMGFSTFALVWSVQPMLPAFAEAFGLTPAQSSLAMSLTTGALAFSIMASVLVSHALGRRGVMCASMALGAALNLAAALSPSWAGILIARALEGLVLGGVPAVAAAYLAEEIEPKSLPRAMGLYIAGNALGGLVGRVGMGVLSEFASWRVALAALGAFCLVSAALAFWLLPVSRNFVPKRGLGPSHHLKQWARHLANPPLLRLFAIGFVLVGIYVTIYNYVGFRLAEAPFGLGQTAISMIFLCVVIGVAASSISGALADRFGKRALMAGGFVTIGAGVLLTAANSVALVVAGVVFVTAGFFVTHAIASASVGPLSGSAKAHSAALYMVFFYVGASVVGSLGGVMWQHWGWSAVAALTCALTAVGLAMSVVATASKHKPTRRIS
jgi:YNFM family putative membrane transporter